MNFFCRKPNENSRPVRSHSELGTRGFAEQEARSDLLKPDEHLLADIHDEVLQGNRPPEYNHSHALKRFAALVVRSSRSADALAKGIFRLTVLLVILTIVLALLTGVLVWHEVIRP